MTKSSFACFAKRGRQVFARTHTAKFPVVIWKMDGTDIIKQEVSITSIAKTVVLKNLSRFVTFLLVLYKI
jgi:hypothetical protein